MARRRVAAVAGGLIAALALSGVLATEASAAPAARLSYDASQCRLLHWESNDTAADVRMQIAVDGVVVLGTLLVQSGALLSDQPGVVGADDLEGVAAPGSGSHTASMSLLNIDGTYQQLATLTFVACGSTPKQCPDVFFIGVRGSGETASDFSGYGRMVDPIRSAFVSHLPAGVTHREFPLDYTASAVSTLAGGILSGNLSGGISQYFASINDGNSKLTDLLATTQRNCPQTKVTIAGWSQGALVANMSARSFSNVAALLLVADPARVPTQVGGQLGSAKKGFGIYQVADRKVSALPQRFASIAINLCTAGDVVCDWSHRGAPHTAAVRGIASHLGYDTANAAELELMGRLAIRRSGFSPTP